MIRQWMVDARKVRGWSIPQAAKNSDVSASIWRYYEAGKDKTGMSRMTMNLIAVGLRMDSRTVEKKEREFFWAREQEKYKERLKDKT